MTTSAAPSVSKLMPINGKLAPPEALLVLEQRAGVLRQNLAGLEFPQHNFVFTEQFTELLRTYRLEGKITL